MHQARMTQSGRMSTATCVLLPTATPREISIRFRYAKTIALACSAAFPTMGKRMAVIKGRGTPSETLAPLMASVISSESQAIVIATMASQTKQPVFDSSFSSSFSSSSSFALPDSSTLAILSFTTITTPPPSPRCASTSSIPTNKLAPPPALTTLTSPPTAADEDDVRRRCRSETAALVSWIDGLLAVAGRAEEDTLVEGILMTVGRGIAT
mmetsp:Transcript_12224/g.21895  ORF Transcript_12224/g.21895 Transcript_12224/m.21895 type:complete len:211 (+) Transcript_12224:498-1130(+)